MNQHQLNQENTLYNYLKTLSALNQNSNHPGKFARLEKPGDIQVHRQARYQGDDGSVFSSHPVKFYNNQPRNPNQQPNPFYLNQQEENNGMPLATFRPLTSQEQNNLLDTNERQAIYEGTRHNRKGANQLTAKERLYRYRFNHNNTYVYNDKYINNILGYSINVDCEKNGLSSKTVLNTLNNYINQQHSKPVMQFIKPSYTMTTGHGLNFTYLVNRPIELSSDPKQHAQQIHTWKQQETILAHHMNQLTTKLFGKALVNTKAVEPTTAIHLPYTDNVKNLTLTSPFKQPVMTQSVDLNNNRYSQQDINQHTRKLAPLYAHALKKLDIEDNVPTHDVVKDMQYYPHIYNTNPVLTNFYRHIDNAREKATPDKQGHAETFNFHPEALAPMYTQYSGYVSPSKGHKRYPHGYYQFNGLDYLAYIGVKFAQDGKDITIEDTPICLEDNASYNSGDNSSVSIKLVAQPGEEYAYKHGKRPYKNFDTEALIKCYSGKWDDVLDSYWIGDKQVDKGTQYTGRDGRTHWAKRLDDVTQLIMLHHNFTKPSQAKQLRYLWFRKMNAEGLTHTQYSYQDGSNIEKGSFTQDHKKNQKKTDQANKKSPIYCDIAMRRWVSTYHAVLKGKEHYLQKVHNTQDPIKLSKSDKAYAFKIAQKQVKSMMSPKVAKDYLIYARGWSPAMTQYYMNRGLVRGYKKHYPLLKDKNGNYVYKNGKAVLDKKHPYDANVEFIHRRPRNSAEAHWQDTPQVNVQNTVLNDINLAFRQHNKKGKPAYYPKAGLQNFIPCASDSIYLIQGKDKNGKPIFRTDAKGHKHPFYVKDMNVNGSGKGIDRRGDNTYGWAFRLTNQGKGNGYNHLYVFEAPIDAESFVQQVYQSGNKKEIHDIQNSTFLALCGSNTKVKYLSHFLHQNYVTGHEFSQVHICTDNDYAGYKTTLKLSSQIPNLKKYMADSTKRQFYVNVPVSPNRDRQDDTLRYGGILSNMTHFNKDWNDEEQSKTFDKVKYPHAYHQYNLQQFEHLMGRQAMVSIYEEDAKLGMERKHSKPQIQGQIQKDLKRFDTLTHLTNTLHKGVQNCSEKIDAGNPRLKAMHTIINEFPKGKMDKQGHDLDGTQYIVNQFIKNVGNFTHPDNLSQGTSDFYKERYYQSDPVLKSQAYKQLVQKPYKLNPQHQSVNRLMQNMPDMNSQKLYTTALTHLQNVWLRQDFEKLHNTYEGRVRLGRLTHKRVYYQSPEEKAIDKLQNHYDSIITKSCLDKLHKTYPKNYQNIEKQSSALRNFAGFFKGNPMKITQTDKQDNLMEARYAEDYLSRHNQAMYQPKEVITNKTYKSKCRQFTMQLFKLNYARDKQIHKNIKKAKQRKNRYRKPYRSEYNHSPRRSGSRFYTYRRNRKQAQSNNTGKVYANRATRPRHMNSAKEKYQMSRQRNGWDR